MNLGMIGEVFKKSIIILFSEKILQKQCVITLKINILKNVHKELCEKTVFYLLNLV